MSSLRPIPHVPPQVDQEMNRFMSSVKQVIETNQGVLGDPLSRVVTLKMLVDAGILTASAAQKIGSS
jgi:hypothetical protein